MNEEPEMRAQACIEALHRHCAKLGADKIEWGKQERKTARLRASIDARLIALLASKGLTYIPPEPLTPLVGEEEYGVAQARAETEATLRKLWQAEDKSNPRLEKLIAEILELYYGAPPDAEPGG